MTFSVLPIDAGPNQANVDPPSDALWARVALRVVQVGPWLALFWVLWEIAVSVVRQRFELELPGAGVGSAVGAWLTAAVAWAAERSLREVETRVRESVVEGKNVIEKKIQEYFGSFLDGWQAVEHEILEMLKEIDADPSSEFYFASYWLGFGADAHSWDFSKAPVPQKILARVEASTAVQGATHLIFLNPRDDLGEDDFGNFVQALVKSTDLKVEPAQLRKEYMDWMVHTWASSFRWFREQQGSESGFDPWSATSWTPAASEEKDGKVRLIFTKRELPLLVALSKHRGKAKAVILLCNSRSLAAGGPIGALKTEDLRLTVQIEQMLENIKPEALTPVRASVGLGQGSTVSSAASGPTPAQGVGLSVETVVNPAPASASSSGAPAAKAPTMVEPPSEEGTDLK